MTMNKKDGGYTQWLVNQQAVDAIPHQVAAELQAIDNMDEKHPVGMYRWVEKRSPLFPHPVGMRPWAPNGRIPTGCEKFRFMDFEQALGTVKKQHLQSRKGFNIKAQGCAYPRNLGKCAKKRLNPGGVAHGRGVLTTRPCSTPAGLNVPFARDPRGGTDTRHLWALMLAPLRGFRKLYFLTAPRACSESFAQGVFASHRDATLGRKPYATPSSHPVGMRPWAPNGRIPMGCDEFFDVFSTQRHIPTGCFLPRVERGDSSPLSRGCDGNPKAAINRHTP